MSSGCLGSNPDSANSRDIHKGPFSSLLVTPGLEHRNEEDPYSAGYCVDCRRAYVPCSDGLINIYYRLLNSGACCCLHSTYMLSICGPPSSSIVALTLNGMVPGDGVFGR